MLDSKEEHVEYIIPKTKSWESVLCDLGESVTVDDKARRSGARVSTGLLFALGVWWEWQVLDDEECLGWNPTWTIWLNRKGPGVVQSPEVTIIKWQIHQEETFLMFYIQKDASYERRSEKISDCLERLKQLRVLALSAN